MDSSHKLMGKQQYPNRKWSGDNMHTHKRFLLISLYLKEITNNNSN